MKTIDSYWPIDKIRKRHKWADDLIQRYDKKYRKYMSKAYSIPKALGSAFTPPATLPPPPQVGPTPMGGLTPYSVSAGISPHHLAMMGSAQAAQYQQMIQNQLAQQLAQQQAQMAAQALQNGQMWMMTTPSVSTMTNVTNNISYVTYSTTSGATTPTTNQYIPLGSGFGGGIVNQMLPLPYPNSPTDVLDRILKIRDGQACEIQLPDGSKIHVDAAGSYVIDDKDAKVVYRANRARDFNRFINVSDRIEEFFEFCGEQDVRADEMMELPMKLFVGWLVVKAAEADKEAPPNLKLIPDLRQRTGIPRCRSCGRFIQYAAKKANMEFCNAVCFDRKLVDLQPKQLPPPNASQTCNQILPQPGTGRSPVLQEADLIAA